VLPAASGITDCVTLKQKQRKLLIDALRSLETQFDYLLIDTGAGIDETVLQFVRAAQHSIVVISPEPTSLTDAFALIKVLVKSQHTSPIHIVINKVANSRISHGVFERFRDVIRTYLNFTVGYLGFVVADNAVKTSVIEQNPVVMLLPESTASRCFNVLASQILKLVTENPQAADFTAYWQSRIEAAGPAEPEPPTLADDLDTTRGKLSKAELDHATMRESIEPLIHAYVERYNTYPLDVREALYTTLEMQDFPRLQILELISNLEAVYQRRYHEPLRDPQDLLIQLLASAADNEIAYKVLARQLHLSYRRRFNKELFPVPPQANN
jgi:flagellar biosynthesis protein FlhG